MKQLKTGLLALLLGIWLCPAGAQGLEEHRLTVRVATDVPGEQLAGQPIVLAGTYGFTFNEVLDDTGQWSGAVYADHYVLTIDRAGFLPYEAEFDVTEDMVWDAKLAEATQTPYALQGEVVHDAVTGRNDVQLTWNVAPPVFFDGFEDYADFSINETGNEWNGWTGIDGDLLATAIINGTYPNMGKRQYAMVINPMEAGEPAWWYQFEQLRPYEGKKYMGFFRTQSGEANDDWLISPALTVEKNNIVQFMAKAGNVNPEHFVVGITTVTDDPQPADFANLTPGNYETADSWAEWRTVQYDLARYEGQTVRIGIHYVGDANRYGCMMLMVDNFYVGQPRYDEMSARARRISPRSVANPNESFRLYVDGEQVAETEAYTYLFEDLAEGTHTLAVEAVYRSGVVSERATLDVVLSNDTCYALALDVTTDNGVSPDGLMLEVLNKATGEVVAVAVDGGKAEMLSLPRGAYSLSIANELYEPYNEEVVMDEAKSLKAALKEKRFTPYNITADVTEAEDGTFAAVVKWNQDLGFYDSFEEYDDFATAFGEWTSLDVDGLPVYPIALGTVDNVVSFPGSGTASSPAVIPPMVFNPARTQPAMYPSDPASAPVYGDKYAIFFSPQQAQADKWLISPELTVREGYVWRFSLKAYSSMYPEMFSLCVSTAGTDPADFTELDQITLSESDWMQYEVDLAAYAGERVYLGFRYRAYDGFFSMLDGVYVGPAEKGEAAEVGAVLHYEVSLDGGPVQEAEEPQCTFTGLAEGEHTVSIVAVYASGRSDEATYTFEVKREAHNGIGQLQADGLVVAAAPGEVRVWTDEAAIALYTPDGCLLETRAAVPGANVFAVAPGVYLVKAGNRTCLTVVR